MLANALLYTKELEKLQKETWYDEKYQFYHGGYFSFNNEKLEGDYDKRYFVSLDKDKNILGFIKYAVDRITNQATGFGVMNFSEPNFTFSKDMAQVIDDIFCKFNHQRMEWYVICGNPIEKSYDELCFNLGGRIIGPYRRTECINQIWYDTKSYEILREDYIKNRNYLISKKRISKSNIIDITMNYVCSTQKTYIQKWTKLKEELENMKRISLRALNSNAPKEERTLFEVEHRIIKDIIEDMNELEREQ